jgi:hypothetical protein
VETPDVRDARNGDVHVAYRAFGERERETVFVGLQPIISNIEVLCTPGRSSVLGTDADRIAVRIAVRVEAKAAEHEVLVTRTLKDLVAGSRVFFQPPGDTHRRVCPTTGAVASS